MVHVLLAQISWVWVCVRVTISWIFCSDPLCDYISLGGRGHERCGLRPSYNNDSESQPIHDLWLLVAQILLSFPPREPREKVFIVNTSTIQCAPAPGACTGHPTYKWFSIDDGLKMSDGVFTHFQISVKTLKSLWKIMYFCWTREDICSIVEVALDLKMTDVILSEVLSISWFFIKKLLAEFYNFKLILKSSLPCMSAWALLLMRPFLTLAPCKHQNKIDWKVPSRHCGCYLRECLTVHYWTPDCLFSTPLGPRTINW